MKTDTHFRRGWAVAFVTLVLTLPLAACQTAEMDRVAVPAAPAQAEAQFTSTADQMERALLSRATGHSTIPDESPATTNPVAPSPIPTPSPSPGPSPTPTPTPAPGPTPCGVWPIHHEVHPDTADALCAGRWNRFAH